MPEGNEFAAHAFRKAILSRSRARERMEVSGTASAAATRAFRARAIVATWARMPEGIETAVYASDKPNFSRFQASAARLALPSRFFRFDDLRGMTFPPRLCALGRGQHSPEFVNESVRLRDVFVSVQFLGFRTTVECVAQLVVKLLMGLFWFCLCHGGAYSSE